MIITRICIYSILLTNYFRVDSTHRVGEIILQSTSTVNMDKFHVKKYLETDYKSRMTNVKLFARAIRLNNIIMDARADDSFKTILRVIDILLEFKAQISETDVPVTEYLLKEVNIELNSKYLLLLRTALFNSGGNAEHSSNDEEDSSNLEKIVRYISSKRFKEEIGKDKKMKMRLRVYNIMMNGDREKSCVRGAFLNMNRLLKEFRVLTVGVSRHGMKTDCRSVKLREAIVDLMRVCFLHTKDADYTLKVFYKFGFSNIYDCACDDFIEGKFDELKMNKRLQNYIFTRMM